MQSLLQPIRAESILQTTEAVERWACDVREYEQRFGKTLDEDVKIGVFLALSLPHSAEPPSLEFACLEELRTSQYDAIGLLPSTSGHSR